MTPTILVTGGGRRLGREIVRAAARAGFRPAVHYNTSAEDAEALAGSLGGVAVGADLSAEGAAPHLIAKAAEALGEPVTALVNSASIFEHDTAQTMSEADLIRNFTINTVAPLMLCQAFAEQAPEGSAIVNILDQKLFALNTDHFSYTVSKQALHGATLLLARALAPKIRVAGVAPGYNLPSPGQDDATFQRLAPTVNVLKRRLEPRDVADTVIFALTNKSITGQVILADNGEHLKPAARDVIFSD